jgi:hypothetical protein
MIKIVTRVEKERAKATKVATKVANLNFAQKLLNDDVSIEKIIDYTGLSVKAVEKLRRTA